MAEFKIKTVGDTISCVCAGEEIRIVDILTNVALTTPKVKSALCKAVAQINFVETMQEKMTTENTLIEAKKAIYNK